MRSPLTAGTLVHSRYSIIQLLGQGGFARTYLAQDQGRFNELCVLKEMIPNHHSKVMVEKSKELFQREATILYQIQHPQIPQFRASLDYEDSEGTRLFLVQDYVAGKTYRQLLSDRRSQGKVFSEAEVRELLVQILPVLDYLHNQGIIHRDISPENLILRQTDRLPVLIDFGVVKEMLTRWQEAENAYPSTAVGKLGFAPMEQLQTGRVYPSSDLYALAVTAVVLLTGQEPKDLFEDRSATWHWHRWARVSPELTHILERMLMYRPGDRFGSAAEVLAAIQSLAATVPACPAIAESTPRGDSEPCLTEGKTLTWESPPPTQPAVLPLKPQPASLPLSWQVISLGGLVALVSGTVGWLIVTGFRAPRLLPVVQSPLPSLPTPALITSQQTLALTQEQTTVRGVLNPNQGINFQLIATAGATLKLSLPETPAIALTVLSPQGLPLTGVREGISQSFLLEQPGRYTLRLRQPPGTATQPQPYSLSVSLQRKAVPSSPPPRENLPEVVSLQPPQSGKIQSITGQARPGKGRRFLIPGKAGQVLTVVVVNGSVTLNLEGPQGAAIANANQVLNWQGILPTTGNYAVNVEAISPTDFELNFSLRNP